MRSSGCSSFGLGGEAGVGGEYDNGDYVLKMSYGVSAAKMVSALGDALKPRCSQHSPPLCEHCSRCEQRAAAAGLGGL